MTRVSAGVSSSVKSKEKDTVIWFEAAHANQGPLKTQLRKADPAQNEIKDLHFMLHYSHVTILVR